MKLHTWTHAGLILSILITLGLLAVPVSAGNDNSWFTPTGYVPGNDNWYTPANPLPAGNENWFTPTGYVPGNDNWYTPANPLPAGNENWFTPASQDQILAWGAKNAQQNAALLKPQSTSPVPIVPFTPYTLSRADLDKLLGQYEYGVNGPAGSVLPATPVPTGTVAPSSGSTGDDLHTIDGTSISLLISRAMEGYRTNPQLPTTTPVLPVYTPSADGVIGPFPTPTTPSGGNTDQGTGISLSAFNLQGKYVRISNTGTTPVVMTGWKITNRQGNALTFINFPLGGGSTFTYTLDPHSTLTVYFGKDGIITSTELYYPAGGNFWNPQGDTASLYNSQGQLVGSITA